MQWLSRCRYHLRLGFQRTLRLIWRATWEDTKEDLELHKNGWASWTPKCLNSFWNIRQITGISFDLTFADLLILLDQIFLKSQVSLWLYEVTGLRWYNAGSTIDNYAPLTGGSRMFKLTIWIRWMIWAYPCNWDDYKCLDFVDRILYCRIVPYSCWCIHLASIKYTKQYMNWIIHDYPLSLGMNLYSLSMSIHWSSMHCCGFHRRVAEAAEAAEVGEVAPSEAWGKSWWMVKTIETRVVDRKSSINSGENHLQW